MVEVSPSSESKRVPLFWKVVAGIAVLGVGASVIVKFSQQQSEFANNTLEKYIERLNKASDQDILTYDRPDGAGGVEFIGIEYNDCQRQPILHTLPDGRLELYSSNNRAYWFANNDRGIITEAHDGQSATEVAEYFCD